MGKKNPSIPYPQTPGPHGYNDETSRTLLHDIEDVIEERHRSGFAKIDAIKDKIATAIETAFVLMGEAAYGTCSTKVSKEVLFDAGATIFAMRYHLQQQFEDAAKRGEADAAARDAKQLYMYDDWFSLYPSIMTRDQHEKALEAAELAMYQARLQGFDVWVNLVGSMGLPGAGTEGSSGGPREGMYQRGEPPPREPSPTPDPPTPKAPAPGEPPPTSGGNPPPTLNPPTPKAPAPGEPPPTSGGNPPPTLNPPTPKAPAPGKPPPTSGGNPRILERGTLDPDPRTIHDAIREVQKKLMREVRQKRLPPGEPPPKQLSASKVPKVVMGDVKSIDGYNKGIRHISEMEGRGKYNTNGNIGIALYDRKTGDVLLQVLGQPAGPGQPRKIIWEGPIGKVQIPAGRTPPQIGNEVEEPVRELVRRVTGQPFPAKPSNFHGPDLITPK